MIHKKLRQMGNSWGLIIPETLPEVMNINPVLDEIGITIENDEIKLKKYKQDKK